MGRRRVVEIAELLILAVYTIFEGIANTRYRSCKSPITSGRRLSIKDGVCLPSSLWDWKRPLDRDAARRRLRDILVA